MPLDKVKLANKKHKREQARKLRRQKAPFDTPLSAYKRRLRNNRNHHRKQEGQHTRRYKALHAEED
jgi:hypothetical protein